MIRVTVFIEAVDKETSLTILSDRYVIVDSYGFISAINFYFLSNFFGDKIYGITSFSVGEKFDAATICLFYVDSSLSRGRNKTGFV